MGSLGARLVLPVFTLTIFVGAALLFVVQPMAAKMLLPKLGGSPAVWNTCMVFFQGLLLLGYLYAHLAPKLLGVGRGAAVHLGVIGGAALLLPIAVPAGWEPPASEAPIGWLLAVLLVAVGAPFFVLSTAGPLVQRWFAATGHPRGDDPYFLYAASNAGSMLGLLAYPVAIEPTLSLREQAWAWAAGYGLFGVLAAGCAWAVWARAGESASGAGGGGAGVASAGRGSTSARARKEARVRRRTGPKEESGGAAPPAPASSITWWTRGRWVLLALAPSSLSLGVTQYLSTDVAAVPMLWVLPLSVYLLTFILAFSPKNPLTSRSAARLLPIIAVSLALAFLLEARSPMLVLMALHLLGLFLGGMTCHGRLAEERPPAERLTEFYLLMALGGVLGGVLNAIVAPLVFDAVYEYPIALALVCLLRPGVGAGWRRGATGRERAGAVLDVVLPIALLGLYVGLRQLSWKLQVVGGWGVPLVMYGLPTLLCFLMASRPARFALGVLVLTLVASTRFMYGSTQIYQDRTFFGVYRVWRSFTDGDPPQPYHALVHGTTGHGRQFLRPELAQTPLSYYHPTGPVGALMEEFNQTPKFDRVAVVGLGTGAMAAYARAGQVMDFYEIDPAMQRLAEHEDYFTYLGDARFRGMDVRVILGDGRRMLERHAPEGSYGLIALDAFTSDAIPVHLMTLEAVRLYLSRLREDGVLAFHVSNRHLRLEPIVARIAQELGCVTLLCDDSAETEETKAMGKSGSVWVLVARTPAALGSMGDDPRWTKLGATPDAPLWTDDFSNIWSIFDWH